VTTGPTHRHGILMPVLVRPRYAGNVGSVLRLAANFSVPAVMMVDPHFDPDDPDLTRMATGATERVCLEETGTLREAVAACDLVVATSSSRDRDPRVVLELDTVVARAAAAQPSRIALVFGPERGGLRREEFQVCHMAATIPSCPEFPVLNLAQAAAIVVAAFSRERFSAPEPPTPMDRPATGADLVEGLDHLRGVLLESGFLDPCNPDRIMEQIGRLVGRAIPSKREVAILRALAAHMAYLTRRDPAPQEPAEPGP
jgi:TrmH family RNA methyltransferase